MYFLHFYKSVLIKYKRRLIKTKVGEKYDFPLYICRRINKVFFPSHLKVLISARTKDENQHNDYSLK